MVVPSRLKEIGDFCVGLALIGALLAISIAFLHGMVWASERALPWLIEAGGLAFDACAFVLLPLCTFKKTRPWAGVGFVVSSFVFGILLLAFSCLTVMQIWGYAGLVIGLLLAGIGVVPLAFLATLFHGEWAMLRFIAVCFVLTVVTRYLGSYLREKRRVERREEVAIGG